MSPGQTSATTFSAQDLFNAPTTYQGSVRVMRSFDYCHFEVCLSTDERVTLDEVDCMRKEAARLVDKAVEQYKIAKEVHASAHNAGINVRWAKAEAEHISAIAETDRTPEQQAVLKDYKNYCFHASRRYDYEDEWDSGELEDPREVVSVGEPIVDKSAEYNQLPV